MGTRTQSFEECLQSFQNRGNVKGLVLQKSLQGLTDLPGQQRQLTPKALIEQG
jgi:hypothetical protein